MKQIIFAAISILTLASCSGGGGSSASEDPVYGEWYYEAPGSTATTGRGVIGAISKDGSITFSYYYAKSNGAQALFYTRKSVGTFQRNGDVFDVKYSYETCDPVGSERLFVTMAGDKAIVQNADKSVSFTMSKVKSLNIQSLTVIEDKNCNILAKIESEKKRIPANAGKESFVQRFNAL